MTWSWRKAFGVQAPAIAEPAALPPSLEISPAAQFEANRKLGIALDGAMIFSAYQPAPGVVPATMATDGVPVPVQALTPIGTWAANSVFHEGLGFLGFPYLAELAQRVEYRHASEIWAEHATRKWIKLTGNDEKVAKISDEFERLGVREAFREAATQDGLFGRSQVFLDFGDSDNPAETLAPLVLDERKINADRPLQRLTVVEPMWSYPADYETRNPLSPDFYGPKGWFVYGRRVDASRLLTMVGREVPDMLKPAYAFGGQALTELMKPYVDNWLRTRQSVSDLIHCFSTMVLSTDMSGVLQGGGGNALFMRADMFNATRDNRGLMIVDKGAEELTNVSVPLSGLDHLQSQAQEQLASSARIPLSIYLQITPTGLNATSEGEIRSFYADVHGYQEKVFRAPLQTILSAVQLSLFGAIDDKIGFDFEDLWEMSDADKSAIRKADAECDVAYINAGVVDPEEARDRLRNDETSLYHGVDLSAPAPEPEPNPASEEDDPLAMLEGGLMPTISPVRPAAPIRAKYEARILALLEELQASIVYWLSSEYRRNEPEIAVYGMDRSPARAMQSAMRLLGRRWRKRFDDLAPKLADYFATAVQSRSERALLTDLRRAGMTVRFKATPAMNDAYQAVRAENVNLIKSIAQQHLTQVETLVMQSVQQGRDLGTLTKELTSRYGVTKRRAAFIARDQNNKATATMTRVRHLELGITKAKWLHSAGGKTPRPEHVAFSGKVYDIAKGHDFGNGEGVVWPGTALNCRCVPVPIVPGFD